MTLLLPNPERRFPLACGPDPDTLGLRVPRLPRRSPASRVPVLQSSANHAGGADARRLQDVPRRIRAGADLVLDGGALPGHAVDGDRPARYEADGAWSVVRAGAVGLDAVATVLG